MPNLAGNPARIKEKSKPPIERLLDQVEWVPTGLAPDAEMPDGMPYATHVGQLRIGNITLDCAVLSTGVRVFTEESILRALSK